MASTNKQIYMQASSKSLSYEKRLSVYFRRFT